MAVNKLLRFPTTGTGEAQGIGSEVFRTRSWPPSHPLPDKLWRPPLHTAGRMKPLDNIGGVALWLQGRTGPLLFRWQPSLASTPEDPWPRRVRIFSRFPHVNTATARIIHVTVVCLPYLTKPASLATRILLIIAASRILSIKGAMQSSFILPEPGYASSLDLFLCNGRPSIPDTSQDGCCTAVTERPFSSLVKLQIPCLSPQNYAPSQIFSQLGRCVAYLQRRELLLRRSSAVARIENR